MTNVPKVGQLVTCGVRLGHSFYLTLKLVFLIHSATLPHTHKHAHRHRHTSTHICRRVEPHRELALQGNPETDSGAGHHVQLHAESTGLEPIRLGSSAHFPPLRA